MLHIVQEGEYCKLGLNLRGNFKERWIAVTWHWYNPATFTECGWYIRLRARFYPHLIVRKLGPVSVIDNYLAERGLVIVSRELAKDKGII